MNWIWYVLLLQALLAFFVAGGLYYRHSSFKNRSVSMLMLLFGCHILIYIAGATGFTTLFPSFYLWFYFEVALLLGPMLFLHLQTMLYGKEKLMWYDAFHLVPVVVYWIGFGDVLVLPGAERVTYNELHFLDRTMLWNYLLAAQMTIYLFGHIVLIFRSKNRLQMKPLSYAIAIVSIYAVATILIAYFTQFANDWGDFKSYYLVNNMLIFLLAYVLYYHPELLAQWKKKYFSSTLEASQKKMIAQNIEKYVVTQQYYLQNDFTIKTLSELIDVPSHHVSQTFSEVLEENFNEYVNRHRALHATHLLTNKEFDHYKIDVIAKEAGFNNKVTFYKAFSKVMGVTPAAYRKQAK
ncbi:MAG: hypothetical protein CMC35_06625 [Flavobacteriaceae bacterium]|nr:hypothetical protein [Flavobacteriaceae bacterium]